MTEIYEFPTKTKHPDTTDAKLDSCPTSTAEIIARGQAVLARLECNLSWSVEWHDLILALGAGRDLALRTAGTDKPHGPKYRAAMGPWLRCYGFDRIDEADRYRLLQCFDNLAAIDAWRAKLPAKKLQKLNHPRTVLAHWKRSLQPEKTTATSQPSQTPELKAGFVEAWRKATPTEKGEALATESVTGLLDLLPPDKIKDLSNSFRAPYERAHPHAKPGPHLQGKWEAATKAEKLELVRNHQDELLGLLDAVTASPPGMPSTDSKTADTNDVAIPGFRQRDPTRRLN